MISLTLPGYEMMGVLGRGGFGVVYRARQVTIDREVAVKVDSRVILDDRDRRRFLREVRAAGRLSGHPHVVEIYDAGVLPDGYPYLVMELCAGGSLAGRGPIAPPDVAGIGRGIADALAAAHGLGVLHRDIKPGNILIKRYGTVGLADFGLAAVIDSGRESSVTLAALTPAYAAPEAFHLHPPTPRSDIYALGATLYALLAGRPPRFPAGADLSLPEIIRLHDAPVPDLPGVPPGLTAVLRRSLAKDPGQRFPDAVALRDELTRWTVPGQPVTITNPIRQPAPAPSLPPAPSGEQHTTPVRRGVLLAGAALTAVLVLLGVWYFAVQDRGDGRTAAGAPTGTVAAPDGEDTADLGVETVTDGCPAAAVPDAQARCVERAECWSGMVLIQGELTSVRRIPCDQEHTWETYAVAPVPADLADAYLDTLEGNPTVAKVCAKEVLIASRTGKALEVDPEKWEPSVMPPTPDDRAAQRAVYRCVGTISGETSSGAAFRPLQP
ncbi:MAG TPA: serine/threonine-protein kinase [Actinophytocola sp.]|uniref:serine/threonine-protein kinase n=1 Tax=Actinophytocola sp. TaxID=1872138 RepID=UPI002DB9DCE7|nr:serine/threonine-protein kinase [Actinophytocola sp.]HEU5475043.1 serine/threonine-protein kinase [Actinophytocola sp.]